MALKEDIDKAVKAQGFLRMNADDALSNFEESSGSSIEDEDLSFRTSLLTLIDTYCGDTALAKGQVDRMLEMLPHAPDRIANAFVAHAILMQTREALREKIGIDLDMLEEAQRGQDGPKSVDDKEIRKSAGYTNDEDVADSALTDKAQEQNITDEDVADSVKQEMVYRDKIDFSSPQRTFIQETHRLAVGICLHCVNSGDIRLLEQAKIIPQNQHPDLLVAQIQKLVKQLEPPRDEDK